MIIDWSSHTSAYVDIPAAWNWNGDVVVVFDPFSGHARHYVALPGRIDYRTAGARLDYGAAAGRIDYRTQDELLHYGVADTRPHYRAVESRI